ncbi:methyl-CpG-binding domain protein [Medicago truncatula]|uniref:Methyl-CpG-binding domain protein n=1 Tax=Medicago truncatula TaxID=3880 RepID=G7L5A3_MEDTR|nr:methyl-CpG-binding domain protein [Medicago truncatula]
MNLNKSTKCSTLDQINQIYEDDNDGDDDNGLMIIFSDLKNQIDEVPKVIDKPNISKTPQGFKRTLVLRNDYSKLDSYYITPTGEKLRARNEPSGVSASDFDFSSQKIMQDTIP